MKERYPRTQLFGKIFCITFAFLSLISFVGIQLDLALNQWLIGAMDQWQWYNYITTRHGLTMCYLKYGAWVLLPMSLYSALLSFYFYQTRDGCRTILTDFKEVWRDRREIWSSLRESW